MAKEKKNAWIAAVLNFILWGLGYVYLGRRVGFGIGLILVGVFVGIMSVIEGSFPLWALLESVAIGILFAYDAYSEAKAK